MSNAPLLLVDNSNSRTKFALVAPGDNHPGETRICPTADISPATISHTLAGWAYSHAVLCSVAPQAAAILNTALGCPVSHITADCCPELLRGYPSSQTLGADRIANIAAAAAHYPLPCIAVDLGTACTFDLVVEDAEGPLFAGGAISPGLSTAAQALAEKTACLPLLTAQSLRSAPVPGALGLCTQQAMHAGLVYGYRGMVQGVLEEMSRSLAQRPSVVITGGDADLLGTSDKWTFHIDKSLTLKGILHLYNTNPEFFYPRKAK